MQSLTADHRGRHIVEHLQTEIFLCFKQQRLPAPAVSCEFEEKLLFVAAVGDIPDLPGDGLLVAFYRLDFDLKNALLRPKTRRHLDIISFISDC